MFETKKRSLVKTIVWRTIATLITLFTVWYYSGDFSDSLRTTLVAALWGMVIFYIHERIWNQISWGKTDEK